MSQNDDVVKLLHRLWLEENARRTAYGLQYISFEQFIKDNQATEKEISTGQLDNRRITYPYRNNRQLTMQSRVNF